MKGKGGSLPVGVPPGFQTELRGEGGAGGPSSASAAATATAQEVKALEAKLNATRKEKELYEKAVSHSSTLLDGMLFPGDASTDAPPPRDPFAVLTKSEGWYSNATSLPDGAPRDEHPAILRSCVLELSLDYCTRVTTRSTNAYLEELGAIPESDPFPSMEEIERRLLDDVSAKEPYCGLIEKCVLGGYEDEECRPARCPFVNDAACVYVRSCFEPSVQDEYGTALGLIEEGEKVMDKDWAAGGGAANKKGDGDATKSAGVGGWGVPAQ